MCDKLKYKAPSIEVFQVYMDKSPIASLELDLEGNESFEIHEDEQKNVNNNSITNAS